MKKNLTNAITLPVILLSAVLATACDNEDPTPSVPGTAPTVARAYVSGYSGDGQALEGENTVKDLQACIFEDGQMTAVFPNIPVSGSTYDIQVGGYTGNLYVVANAGSQLDLTALKERGTTEEEWLRHTLTMDREGPAHFFSGRADLSSAGQPTVPVSLQRGVARFDLKLRTAGETSVSGITFRNVAQSVHLFPVPGVYSPADVSRDVAAVTFDEPLTTDKAGVLYVYEQANDDITVEVDALIDGRPVKLTKTLAGDLKRNTIYTLTVRKDHIDVTLDNTFEDWETGSDTELTPTVRHL